MYPQHIQEAAAAIGRTLTESATPLYGSGLRLPDRRAVIELVKEVRRLLFPAYFGDPALMSLAPENYAALLLERICEKLTEQLKLALPEDQVAGGGDRPGICPPPAPGAEAAAGGPGRHV